MQKATINLVAIWAIAFAAIAVLSGCSNHKTTFIMPAPVIYHDSVIDPFLHLDESQKDTITKVFYATNRLPDQETDTRKYGNAVDTQIHLGIAEVLMGHPTTDWDQLHQYSIANSKEPMPVKLDKTSELAVMPTTFTFRKNQLSPELQKFIDLINEEIATAIDKEIMVYVHGTKVDFANSAILTAEVDHFAGRDFVGVAFAWPSHQNILAYLAGIDVRRAISSSAALQSLLVLLAEHTNAEHINILAYSAGGKVASKALFDLRQSFPDLTPEQLRDRFRLGAVVLAAADVSVDVFEERAPSISEIARQVVITVTENDHALKAAKTYMGGAVRMGSQDAEAIEEAYISRKHLSNIEIIDVSLGKLTRGFDIEGHHYWYRHPWMSSDIIFLMRTDLPPAARGLTADQLEGVWYLSPDYPDKIREAAKSALKGQW